MRVRSGRLLLLASVLAGIALLAPSGAGAATVVNGDFESGSLSGWDLYRSVEVGDWFAYSGSDGSGDPIAKKRGTKFPQPPPQGDYAATSDQITATTTILSQNISLAAGLNHRLSLLAYYNSEVPIAVPAPDTLSVDDAQLGGQANQQFRIDVIRPGSPIESLSPADVLATVFRTQPGAPTSMQPTWLSGDLSAFAGQTVRLRFATAAHEELFTAGIDAVAVDSTPAGKNPPPLGSNRFEVVGPGGGGKATVKRVGKNGVATLVVRVPGPGQLTAKGKLIKRTTAKALKAGKVKLRLKLTKSALRTLLKKGQLPVKVAVTFDPAGGKPRTSTVPLLFKLTQQ
jgi:hypothetical protein